MKVHLCTKTLLSGATSKCLFIAKSRYNTEKGVGGWVCPGGGGGGVVSYNNSLQVIDGVVGRCKRVQAGLQHSKSCCQGDWAGVRP